MHHIIDYYLSYPYVSLPFSSFYTCIWLVCHFYSHITHTRACVIMLWRRCSFPLPFHTLHMHMGITTCTCVVILYIIIPISWWYVNLTMACRILASLFQTNVRSAEHNLCIICYHLFIHDLPHMAVCLFMIRCWCRWLLWSLRSHSLFPCWLIWCDYVRISPITPTQRRG